MSEEEEPGSQSGGISVDWLERFKSPLPNPANAAKRSVEDVRWKPGQSGGGTGIPKGFVKISTIYQRLLALPKDELDYFEPKSVAEELALRQVEAARGIHNLIRNNEVVADITLPAVKEITDRTEGKAAQTVTVNTEDDQERMRLASQTLATDIVSLLTRVRARQVESTTHNDSDNVIDITPNKVTDLTVR